MSAEHESRKNSEKIKNLLAIGGATALLLSTLVFTFTRKQVLSINERDEHQCQNPDCENDGDIGDGGHVHHILPQRYAEKLGLGNVDYPENGILLCVDCHVGWFGVHPDMKGALVAYGGNIGAIDQAVVDGMLDSELADILKEAINEGNSTDSFDLVMEWRNELLKKREIYWDPKWDGIFHEIAIRRTIEARESGWEFSKKSKGNNFKLNQEVVGKMGAHIRDLPEAELEELFDKLADEDEAGRITMHNFYQDVME